MIARCEYCGKVESFKENEWPEGWSQSALSRFGTCYSEEGLAWWCSKECLARVTGTRKVEDGSVVIFGNG